VGELLERRRKENEERIERLRAELTEGEVRCTEKACVYAIGSFGRKEASPHSDLDLFIAGLTKDKRPLLRPLDEILVKADLIEVTRRHKIPEFSGDGRYLVHYTVDELVDTLGTREDDAKNTFTARLLLLLESQPLLGRTVYAKITEDVITAYWRDFEDHKSDFIPAFLANDILRMWRTFCVNYEAATQSAPAEEKAKRKLKNYKLKHSRLLTCYSALLYLLASYSRKGTVSPSDAVEMIKMSPTQRLEWLMGQAASDAHSKILDLLNQYERFLASTDASEDSLIKNFLDKEQSKMYLDSAYRFGDLVAESLEIIGQGNRFYRLIVV